MEQTKRSLLKYQERNTPKTRPADAMQPYYDEDIQRMPGLIMSCYNAWYSLAQWRKDIRRNEEFVYGDQHSDRVYDARKRRMVTERQLFVEQGLQPSQYNIIRNVIRTIVGVWGSNKTLPVCVAQKEENQADSDVLTATLHALYRKNELWKLDYAQLTQLLITGMMGSDNNFANRDGDVDIVNDYIDPFNFFVDNSMKDPRYKDCALVGFFVDMAVEDIVGAFSKGSKQRAETIRSMYRGLDQERIFSMAETFTDQRLEKDFFTPDIQSYGMGRVIKVWRKETAQCYWVHDKLNGTYVPDYRSTEAQLKQENLRRAAEQQQMGVLPENMLLLEYEWGTNSFWKYYFMTPMGEVLDSGINPFWHKQPSIIFELHEFFVGKIYPFVKDLIDTQKQINKLSAISELLTKFSAKSKLFVPAESLATELGFGIEHYEETATDFDTVTVYNHKAGVPPPNYVNTVAEAFTPLNVVNMYLKLSENVSGVYGALQGSAPTAGTPAQMYAQQSQNSATSLGGIFESLSSFRLRRDKMNVQLMQQYYTDKQYIYDQKSGKRILWDPKKVRNIEFEMSVVENTDTPAYRLMVNETLMNLKQYDLQNQLDLRGILETGSFPFKEQLINYLNKSDQQRQEAMATGQPMNGQPMPAELQQQLAGYKFSPEVMQQLQQMPAEKQQQILGAVSSKQ